MGTVSFDIPVRFADLDTLRHVNNVRALEFIQEARVAMIHELGYSFASEHGGAEMAGVSQYIARIENDYLAPILLEHRTVTVTTWISRIGNSSYQMRHEATIPDGTVVLRAVSTMVCIDPATSRSTRIPDGLRALMERHLIAD